MGLFDWLTGTGRPPPGTAVQTLEGVRAAVLALDRADQPWGVRVGGPGEAELVAEWRIADARWFDLFGAAGLQKAFQLLMRLDSAACKVRAVDQDWTVTWSAGVPTLTRSVSGFRGQERSVEWGRGYGISQTLRPGEVYRYRFASDEIKRPVRDAVLACGWSWRGVTVGKL